MVIIKNHKYNCIEGKISEINIFIRSVSKQAKQHKSMLSTVTVEYLAH